MDSLESIISNLIKEGIFGSGQFLQLKMEEENTGFQMASEVSFAVITMNSGNSTIINKTEIPIFIKRQVKSMKYQDIVDCTELFWVELYMYTKVLSYFKVDKLGLFPKFYYGNATRGKDKKKDIIILQNLTKDEYFISKEKLFLDYNHIVIALRKLAEFHAKSYINKQNDKMNFFSIVENLKFTKFYAEKIIPKQFYSLSTIRSLNQLIQQEKHEIELINKIKECFFNYNETLLFLLKPEEPFAVICHGDFCINNILYKYNNGDDKNPIDVKFIDLQNSIYSNPIIDLSFFLYMNTTAELRNNYWDEFIKIYWDILKKIIPNINFTFKQFLVHFSKYAIFGLIPISLLMPIINDDLKVIKATYFLSEEEREKKILTFGGKETCKIMLDITKHMLKQKYLHTFLENIKK